VAHAARSTPIACIACTRSWRRINGDKIGDFSIKYNPDANWTRALKYTLVNLKWLMAWVSRHTA